MSTWLTMVCIELQSMVRGVLPATWLRRSVIGFGALLVLAVIGASVMVPLPPGRSAPPPGTFTGFVVLNLGLSVSLAMGGAARLIQRPERVRVLLLAPVSPRFVVWTNVGPVLALACAALTLLFLPFGLLAFRMSPRLGLFLLTLGLAITAWAVQLALWSVAALVRTLGRRRGIRATYALTLGGVLLSTLGFGLATQLVTSAVPLIIFAAATVLLLPPWMSRTGREFVAVLTSSEAVSLGTEPKWGRPMPWRHVRRTPAVWSMAGTAVLILVFAFLDAVPLQKGLVAMMLIVLAMTPLQHAFMAEHERPERWALAPEASRVRWMVFAWVGGPMLAGVAAIVLLFGWGAWIWIGAVIVLAVLGQLLQSVAATIPRRGIETLLLGLAVGTEALW